MIGRIYGKLIEKQAPTVLIDVGGLCYEVDIPMTTLYRLPELGAEVSLFTHFVVREDAQLLYGFFAENDRTLFRTLIKVSGVGPKLALTILSGMDGDTFVRCVQQGDSATLVQLPGVGAKTADRLMVEMRDKLKSWIPDGAVAKPLASSRSANDLLVADAESALVALGYKPQQASRAIAAVYHDGIENSEDLIRLSLRSMVKVK
ncbi:MAG: Holliday junction DNA helicase RuvA [Halieaceae bacterium]|jgi:Holliday junction DNA helicase RuvA